MAKVTISVMNTLAKQKVERLIAAIGPAPMLKVIGARLESFVDESFRTNGRGRWPPLAASTVSFRREASAAPLQDTGKYKQSFVSETDGRTYVEVGSSLRTASGIPLAGIHEYGTGPYVIRARTARILAAQTRAGNWVLFGKLVNHPGIPARPVLPTQPEAEKLVQETVDEMITMEVERAGG